MNVIHETKLGKLIQGDCLEQMKYIEDKSVDMILCDLPYGTVDCKWDTIIPFTPLWNQYERIIKDEGAIVLFANQPFTSLLITSNLKLYKYNWVWVKSNPTGAGYAKYRPMSYHEDICVFGKGKIKYNPQMIPRLSPRVKQAQDSGYIFKSSGIEQHSGLKPIQTEALKYNAELKNPSTVLHFNSLRPNSKEKVKHPTQKPLALFEYLIKTYTNENNLVLDNCLGSGTTAVTCENLNRRWIGIELEEKYCEITKNRLINSTQ